MRKKSSAKKPLLPSKNPAIINNRYCFLMWAKTGKPQYLNKLRGERV
ncbi:hypothetical protein PAECIP111802_03474 [Paenibacillus allorhizosphaerae]|uniref:Uncharacterized protein n=1 Tax=Paenibacillus allorhizosphaerae TaxID=2849866 RepID=A0ABM8VJA6_9BACL|nr:hypothetical protein PAECIP111802_03474 [Paenibacillus allorhizosphaerae]